MRLLIALLMVVATDALAIVIPLKVTVSAINVAMLVSRSTCVAPCSVFFDTVGTTSAAVTSYPFHEVEYRWNFGDSGSGSWTYGSGSNTSKNVHYGPVAAHVYETAGTYTATLTAYDGTNTASQTQTITVSDPDTYFSTTNTICVNASGGVFTGCPAGSSTQTQANFATAINTYLAQGKRVLFKKGDTFTASIAANFSANGPWHVGAFGSGSNPVIQNTGNVNVLAIGDTNAGTFPSDGRIVDLEIDGSLGVATQKAMWCIGNFDTLLVLRLYVHDTGDGLNCQADALNLAGNIGHSPRNWNIQDTQVGPFGNSQGESSGLHGLDAIGVRFAAQGNYIHDSTGEHLVRLDYLNRAVLAYNKLTGGPASKETIAIRGTQLNSAGAAYLAYVPGIQPTQYVQVSDNEIAVHATVGVQHSPANDTIVVLITDTIVERNWIYDDGASAAQVAVSSQTNRNTTRNNVVNCSGFLACNIHNTRAATTGMLASANHWTYNNTAYSSAASNNTNISAAVADATGALVTKNNLLYQPAGSGGNGSFDVFCYPSGTNANCTTLSVTRTNNSTGSAAGGGSTNQQELTNPLFTSVSPFTPANAKPTVGSYAINGGTSVPVWSDFGGNAITGTREIGAWQF